MSYQQSKFIAHLLEENERLMQGIAHRDKIIRERAERVVYGTSPAADALDQQCYENRAKMERNSYPRSERGFHFYHWLGKDG